jgi:hypothetical protein
MIKRISSYGRDNRQRKAKRYNASRLFGVEIPKTKNEKSGHEKLSPNG